MNFYSNIFSVMNNFFNKILIYFLNYPFVSSFVYKICNEQSIVSVFFFLYMWFSVGCVIRLRRICYMVGDMLGQVPTADPHRQTNEITNFLFKLRMNNKWIVIQNHIIQIIFYSLLIIRNLNKFSPAVGKTLYYGIILYSESILSLFYYYLHGDFFCFEGDEDK